MTIDVVLWTALISFLSTALSGQPGALQNDKVPIPKDVAALAGTYTGSWTLYGIDKSG